MTTRSIGGGSFTMTNSTTLAVQASGIGESMLVSNLTFGAGSMSLEFGNVNSASSPLIQASGAVTNVDVGTVTLDILSGFLAAGQSYPLVKYGTLGGSGEFALGALPQGVSASLVTNTLNNTLDLTVTAVDALTWNGNIPGGLWDINTTANWKNSGGPGQYYKESPSSDMVLFDDTLTGTPTITLNTLVAPGSIAISNETTAYVLSGTGGIGGSAGFLKEGNSTITLATTNSYAGGTRIKVGTLKLGNNNVLPDGGGKGDVEIDGTLDLNGFSDSINGLNGMGLVDNASTTSSTLAVGLNNVSSTFSGVLANSGSGSLSLTKLGTGTLTITGAVANTYLGTTTVSNGVLVLSKTSGYALGGAVVIGDGVASDVVRIGANNQQFAPDTIFQFYSGASGNSAFLQLGNFNQTVGGLTNLTPGMAAVVEGNAELTVSNAVNSVWDAYLRNSGGTLSLVKDGPAAFLLKGANNTYTGGTTIKAGIVAIGNANVLADAGAVTLNGPTAEFDLGGFSDTVGAVTLTEGSITNGTLTGSSYTVVKGTISAVLAGGGTLVKNGQTAVVLTTNNSYSGATTINGGTLQVGNGDVSGSLGSSAVTITNSSVLALNVAGSPTLANNITFAE
jgi:autotransporter-associated beta strand protein